MKSPCSRNAIACLGDGVVEDYECVEDQPHRPSPVPLFVSPVAELNLDNVPDPNLGALPRSGLTGAI